MIDQKAFYQKVESWIKSNRAQVKKDPLFVGINGPQGAGKSTLSAHLVESLNRQSVKTVCISIDDFYLTHEAQQKLAQESGNLYLQQRGYPGTHDLALGKQVLQDLKSQNPALIPRYNKSAFQGEGDRLPKEKWTLLSKAQDVVILEGWMLGFQPVNKDLEPALQTINSCLSQYEAWNQYLDIFLYLKPVDPHFVVDWRIEAEKNRRDQGLGGMTDDQAKAYVETFLPAYSIYAESVQQMRNRVHSFLEVSIQKNRQPISIAPLL